MNAIVTITGGQTTTTTMAIADGTDVEHKAVIQLARTYLADLKEFGGVAFEMAPFETAGGLQKREVAILNEQQSTLLLTYMRNTEIVRTFKKRLVKEFWDMRAPAPVALTMLQVLEMATKAEVARLELVAKIAIDAPKVEFAEAVRDLDGVCSIEKVAKTMGHGRNKFFKLLKDASILMRNNLPYQKYLDQAYFTVIEQAPFTDSKGKTHPVFQSMVTGRGQVWLQRRYCNPAQSIQRNLI